MLFHRVILQLSVVSSREKEAYPLCIVTFNKPSFEPFMCLNLVLECLPLSFFQVVLGLYMEFLCTCLLQFACFVCTHAMRNRVSWVNPLAFVFFGARILLDL